MQLIGKVDEVIAVVQRLSSFQIGWEDATKELEAYTGE